MIPLVPVRPVRRPRAHLAPMVAATFLLVALALPAAARSSQVPTDCSHPTPAETEGPYFKAGSPDQENLSGTGMTGMALHLSGYVTDASCQPIAGALVDFWQADASGQYDNSGYSLRGHQYTGADGRYELETVVPGLYPGRTRHIHVKVQAPGGPALTTQLYFPNESNNARDGIFLENGQQLLMNIQPAADGSLSASFNFVLLAP